ncbi:MAG: response regulator [Desulfomonile sp.]|nr:response regulator [Desulfomonile sp.]
MNVRKVNEVDAEATLELAPAFDPDLGDVTQTINLGSLFSPEVTASGTFDLRQIRRAAFGRFLQALSVPTLLLGRSQKIEFANDAFKNLAPKSFDPLALTFGSLFTTPKQAREAQMLLRKVFADRLPAVRETTLSIQEVRIWARIHLRTIRLGDEKMVLVQIENLTAEKQLLTIQKYKKLVEIFPIGIAEFVTHQPIHFTESSLSIEIVSSARVIDGNTEFARMYNRSLVKDLIGLPFSSLFPMTDSGKKLSEEWLKDGCPIRSFETRERGMRANLKYFENTLIGNVHDRQLRGFWWLKRDISEKKRTEAELLKAQKLESLGILAGGIAHDFNNLLTGIIGNISIARLYLDSGHAAAGRIERASNAAYRAQDLTRQLLTFSKGGNPIKSTASISRLLKDCASFVLRGSNVRCRFALPDDLWPVIMDEGQIGQVINNVVINACQAMPSGGTITIKASNVAIGKGSSIGLKEGRYVRISVTDTGVGIPLENIRKIFDPYFTTKEKGTGLGLALSYSIIQKHGGVVTVRSKVGVGTSILFYLRAPPATSRVREGTSEPPASKGKILVMDDEPIILELARDALIHFRYDVVVAKDGEEAVEQYRQAAFNGRPFDVVIMDLTVPGGMGGKEAIRHLLEIDSNVKAIVSSGYSDDPIMSNFEKYGFRAVLPKPYDGLRLRETLEKLIGAPNDSNRSGESNDKPSATGQEDVAK